MKKRRFCHNPRKKRGKFVCILQSDVDKLRTHTRALDDEEVKDKEEELEDVLHHHQNCRSYSFFASNDESDKRKNVNDNNRGRAAFSLTRIL